MAAAGQKDAATSSMVKLIRLTASNRNGQQQLRVPRVLAWLARLL